MKYFSKSVPPPKTFQRRRRIFLPSFFRSVLLIASKWGNFLFLFMNRKNADAILIHLSCFTAFMLLMYVHFCSVIKENLKVFKIIQKNTTDEEDQIRQRNVTFIAAAAAAAIEIAIIAAVVLSSTEEKKQTTSKKEEQSRRQCEFRKLRKMK